MTIKRGEIHLAVLDPTLGREIAKTRPVIIVSNNANNQFSGTVTVVPVTSKKTEKIYPFEVMLPKGVGSLPKDSKAKADQIRTLDKNRIIKKIGVLNDEEMAMIDAAMRIHLGMDWHLM